MSLSDFSQGMEAQEIRNFPSLSVPGLAQDAMDIRKVKNGLIPGCRQAEGVPAVCLEKREVSPFIGIEEVKRH